MSYKVTCPACTSHTSAIADAFGQGEPCPYCGLPSEAFYALTAAKARGAEQSLLDMTAKAEARAGKAEAEVERLRTLLSEIRWTVERVDNAELPA